jgi:hypothetical protein
MGGGHWGRAGRGHALAPYLLALTGGPPCAVSRPMFDATARYPVG